MILVIARCLNEERFLPRFLLGYDWADGILLADGGSTDDTLRIAAAHPKVEVLNFPGRENYPDGRWMNPENAHAQFLFDHAEARHPDWIVYDDMDCVPNALLRARARTILESETLPQVNAYRLYLWLQRWHFPSMLVGKSLWAWKPSAMRITSDISQDPFNMEYKSSRGWQAPTRELELPLCLLHDGWTDVERVDAKMARYASWGRPQIYPLQAFGPAEPLPEYAHE